MIFFVNRCKYRETCRGLNGHFIVLGKYFTELGQLLLVGKLECAFRTSLNLHTLSECELIKKIHRLFQIFRFKKNCCQFLNTTRGIGHEIRRMAISYREEV